FVLTAYSTCTVVRLSFFYNYPRHTEIYTLSLHDALPIFPLRRLRDVADRAADRAAPEQRALRPAQHLDAREIEQLDLARVEVLRDRKSTRLDSSHVTISYAVFCLKKKKNKSTKENKTCKL